MFGPEMAEAPAFFLYAMVTRVCGGRIRSKKLHATGIVPSFSLQS